MFVGCSEINIVVIVKHVQNIEIVRAFYLPGGACSVFQSGGTEKIAELWFASDVRYPG